MGWIKRGMDDKKHFKSILTGQKDRIKIIRWNIIRDKLNSCTQTKREKKRVSRRQKTPGITEKDSGCWFYGQFDMSQHYVVTDFLNKYSTELP